MLDDSAIDAFIELRAQATRDESFERALLREVEAIRARVVRIIRHEVDEGVFRDIDRDAVAEFIFIVLEVHCSVTR